MTMIHVLTGRGQPKLRIWRDRTELAPAELAWDAPCRGPDANGLALFEATLDHQSYEPVHVCVHDAEWESDAHTKTLPDFLLQTGIAKEITLHLKPYPTFVSDAMIKDVLESIDALGQSSTPMLQQLAARLAQAITDGQLTLREHPFWVSGFFFHNLPDGLRATLAQSSLVISKGDANYRRLIGDCHWESTAPFASAVEHFPAPVVAVRTLKSEPVVGLPRGVADKLRAQDPAWSIHGRYGVIQFSEK